VDKWNVDSAASEFVCMPCFHYETALVTKYLGLDDHNTGQFNGDESQDGTDSFRIVNKYLP
jgi:hypothetical protein